MQIQNARDLAAFVRAERKRREWSQATLAEKVGVGRDWIIEFEKGKATVELGLALRTLRMLDLSIGVEPASRPSKGTGADLDEILGKSSDS